MSYKLVTLIFVASIFLLTATMSIFATKSNYITSHKKKRYIKQKKQYVKKPYFDPDILRAKQHSWNNNHNYQHSIANFRPHHPHHTL